MTHSTDFTSSTSQAARSPEPVAATRGLANIKASHRRRSRNPQASPQVLPVRQRPRAFAHHAQATTADEANASLIQFAEQHGLYDVILRDDPVAYGRRTENMNHNASPSKHYPTMSNQALMDFDVRHVCAPNCIMGMWTPASQLPFAIKRMERVGFQFITAIVWHKLLPSGKPAHCATKSAVLPEHEFLLLGRRGTGVPIPRAGQGADYIARIHGVIAAVRGAHSQKPTLFHDELMRLFPTTKEGRPCRFLELFARAGVPGWDAWGNQAPGSAPLPEPEFVRAAQPAAAVEATVKPAGYIVVDRRSRRIVMGCSTLAKAKQWLMASRVFQRPDVEVLAAEAELVRHGTTGRWPIWHGRRVSIVWRGETVAVAIAARQNDDGEEA
ncbi:hypothetical protein ASG87_01345 [Frateuria sp. Soil773]|uniref:MT-A70 family methyltransferase n=1 Tax=Frateuria sp. Soil773 TaxID=1736407 RepID=UPI0006FE3127|nr:MT-A70 family methyltransferase [Frateuria sp. Soil773]KRE90808.1 hypothetical protein ASG87_01345 [Frateuria sp. Soil773]